MPTVSTMALHGLTGHPLTITAAVADGPPGIVLAGPQRRDDPELRDRIRAALANSGQPHRDYRVVVHVDEPAVATPSAAAVATAALIATAALAEDMPNAAARMESTAVLGEVGLDGSLRPTRGTLPAVRAARAHGFRRVIVPAAALGEASLVDRLDVLGAHTLADIADWLRDNDTALHRPSTPVDPVPARQPAPMTALTPAAHRAVTIAAAGGHHLLADVDTDAGTLPLASWLHALLPDLTPDQQLEQAAIQSLIGPREDGATLVSTPPMVITHHTAPLARLLGGHAPGQVSQAHHGVLFTELNGFSASAQDALRAVLIERAIRINQAGRLHRYPAAFQLLATSIRASSPRRWRLSLALRDTIDIQITAARNVTSTDPGARDVASVARLLTRTRAQVAAARTRAADRWSLGPTITNAAVPHDQLHMTAGTAIAADHVRRAQHASGLTRRGDLAVRLAWTFPGQLTCC
ncbi:ATP-binding protein [Amycolatopsis magusensis]|uniref:ATP-binding protein n=1 Tax=Amycolatopsis magusensis TaxID=882444 RepID=UPI0037A2BE25